jgi:hypothetical protein
MAKHGAKATAPIKPTLRRLREKLIDIEPPLIFDCSEDFFSHPLGTTE